MKVLNGVAEIHPFVKGKLASFCAEAKRGSVIAVVAVLAFQAAISFELTRRENDKKILALHVEMSDMMTVVSL